MGVFGLKVATFALSAAMLATSFAPSQAFTQIPIPTLADRSANVETVGYRDRGFRHGYYRRGGYSYYNGHRGYGDYRPGYRRHNGVWFPLAAFATGAVIGGAIVSRPAVRYGGSHTEWCSNRYRSYRVYDNSYQPNYGPRRECNSPY